MGLGEFTVCGCERHADYYFNAYRHVLHGVPAAYNSRLQSYWGMGPVLLDACTAVFFVSQIYVLDQGVNHRMSWSETALYARSWVLEHHLRTKSLGVQGLGFGVVYSPNFAACRQSATDATTGIARWRCGSCKASGVDDLRAK